MNIRSKFIVGTPTQVQQAANILKDAQEIAIDIESSGLLFEDGTNPFKGWMVGFGVACRVGEDEFYAFYFPFKTNNRGAYTGKMWDEKQALTFVLTSANKTADWLMFNAKFDLKWLEQAGGCRWPAAVLRDPMIEQWMVTPASKFAQIGLKYLTELYYPSRLPPIKFEDIIGRGKKRKKLEDVDLKTVAEYCMDDCLNTIFVSSKTKEAMFSTSPRLWELYRELEMPVLRILTDMETRGASLNRTLLDEMAIDIAERLEVGKKELKKIADINWNSTAQVIEVLTAAGVDLPKIYTPTGKQKLDKDVLELIKDTHPAIAWYKEVKDLSKLDKTYITNFYAQLDSNDKIHCDFRQANVATGRLSCGNPNLQNVPARPKKDSPVAKYYAGLRKLFIGSPLMVADLSQIEMRFAAHFSCDSALLYIYENDLDIHKYTSDSVTAGDRTLAKNVNFGFLYGQRAQGLSNLTGMPIREARVFIANFEKTYARLVMWTKRVEAHARADGYVETILGRRRTFANIKSGDWTLAAAEARQSVNTVVQGSAADYLKQAMVNMTPGLAELGWHITLQVHDELVFEPEDAQAAKDVAHASELVRYHMENAIPLRIPVRAEPLIVSNWSEAK